MYRKYVKRLLDIIMATGWNYYAVTGDAGDSFLCV